MDDRAALLAGGCIEYPSMALNWQRIEEADSTDASLWMLVDELHNNAASTNDVEKVEQLLKFGSLPPKVYCCIDEALSQARVRTTQRIQPIWSGTVGESERVKLRDTFPDDRAIERSDNLEITVDQEGPDEPTEQINEADLAPEDEPTERLESLHADFTSESVIGDLGEPSAASAADSPGGSTTDSAAKDWKRSGWLRAPELISTAPIENWSIPEHSTIVSGIFARPNGGVLDLLPTGLHSIRFSDNVYEDVDAETLVHLFRRGVLLGAEVRTDDRWIPVSEHPDFEGFNRATQAEFDRIVSRYESRPEEVTRPNVRLEDVHPEGTNIFEKSVESNESNDPSELTEVFSSMVSNAAESDTNIVLIGDLDPDFSFVDPSVSVDFDDAPTANDTPSSRSVKSAKFGRDFKVADELLFPLPPSVSLSESSEDTTKPQGLKKKFNLDVDPDAVPESISQDELVTADVPRQDEIETAEIPRFDPGPIEEPVSKPTEPRAQPKRENTERLTSNHKVPVLSRRDNPTMIHRAETWTAAKWSLLTLFLVVIGGAAYALSEPGQLRPKTPVEMVPVQDNSALRAASSAVGLALVVPADNADLQRSVAEQLAKGGDYPAGIRVMQVVDRSTPTPQIAATLAEWKLKAGDFAGARIAAIEALHRGGESIALRNIFGEAIRHDASLRPEAHAFQPAEHADAIKVNRDKPFVLQLTQNGVSQGYLFLNHKKSRGLPRRMIAARSYCEVVGCEFELAPAEYVSMGRKDIEDLMSKKDAKKVTRNVILDGPKGDKRLLAMWMPVRKVSHEFPLRVTQVWTPWLDPSSKEDALQRRFTTYLLPWDDVDPNLRPEFAKVAETSTPELAAHVSSLMLFGTMLGSGSQFDSKDALEQRLSTDGKRLINGSYHDVFQGRLSSKARKAAAKANRFNVREALALNLISPSMMDEVLFPEPARFEKSALRRFWQRRDRWSRRYESLVVKHGEPNVILVAQTTSSSIPK